MRYPAIFRLSPRQPFYGVAEKPGRAYIACMSPFEAKRAAWPFQPTIPVEYFVVGATKQKLRRYLGLPAILALGFGLNGFFPSESFNMPSWLAMALTVCGGLALYLLRDAERFGAKY